MAEHAQSATPGSHPGSHGSHPGPPGWNPGTDYERRDVHLLPLALIGLGLFIFLGIAPLILLAGFPRTAHDVFRQLTIRPPEPRLQTDPRADLETYLEKEHHLLDSYGWVDRAHGIARIPIAVAMRREVRGGIAGFPKASQPLPARGAGTEESSGAGEPP